MDSITNTTESRRILKRYLSQYFRAKEKQAALRARLADLQEELRHPGVRTQPTDSAHQRGRISSGAASLTLKIADIEDRIQKQICVEARAVSEIMDVLDFLPADSIERDILEFRHIDCKPWNEIMSLVHLTRSPCFEYYNRGLDKLLTYKKVRVTLDKFEAGVKREKRDAY